MSEFCEFCDLYVTPFKGHISRFPMVTTNFVTTVTFVTFVTTVTFVTLL
jgi:hypothetical protein